MVSSSSSSGSCCSRHVRHHTCFHSLSQGESSICGAADEGAPGIAGDGHRHMRHSAVASQPLFRRSMGLSALRTGPRKAGGWGCCSWCGDSCLTAPAPLRSAAFTAVFSDTCDVLGAKKGFRTGCNGADRQAQVSGNRYSIWIGGGL